MGKGSRIEVNKLKEVIHIPRNLEVSGKILDVNKKGNKLLLEVNFDSQLITLFKEVRNLQWLGFRVPFAITLLSR